MEFRSSSLTARWIAVAATLGAAALAGLAPASCTLVTEGTHPTSPSSGPGGGGTGGGTSSSMMSSSSSSGGGQGGTGGVPNEDCFDGADNDGDGDADCADADCTPT